MDDNINKGENPNDSKCTDTVENEAENSDDSKRADADENKEFIPKNFMYKDILREIYMDVKYESDKEGSNDSDKLPRVIDYAREVLKYFEKRNQFITVKGKEIDDPTCIEREVRYALESLKSEGLLGKIGAKYVPIAQAYEHQGRQYLLKYLHLVDGQMILEDKQTLVFPLTKFKRTPLSADFSTNEPKESSTDKEVQEEQANQTNQEKTLSDIELLQQEIKSVKEQMLNTSKEIAELRNQVAGFAEERRIRERIQKLKLSLKKFIGFEYCSWVFEVDNSIVVLLDSGDEETLHKILAKLIFLIKEINEKKALAKAAAEKKAKEEKRKNRKKKNKG